MFPLFIIIRKRKKGGRKYLLFCVGKVWFYQFYLFIFLSLGRIKSDNSLISFWCFGYFFETFLIDVWFDPPSIKKIEASSTKNEGQMEYWSSFEIQEFPWAIQMRRSGGGGP